MQYITNLIQKTLKPTVTVSQQENEELDEIIKNYNEEVEKAKVEVKQKMKIDSVYLGIQCDMQSLSVKKLQEGARGLVAEWGTKKEEAKKKIKDALAELLQSEINGSQPNEKKHLESYKDELASDKEIAMERIIDIAKTIPDNTEDAFKTFNNALEAYDAIKLDARIKLKVPIHAQLENERKELARLEAAYNKHKKDIKRAQDEIENIDKVVLNEYNSAIKKNTTTGIINKSTDTVDKNKAEKDFCKKIEARYGLQDTLKAQNLFKAINNQYGNQQITQDQCDRMKKGPNWYNFFKSIIDSIITKMKIYNELPKQTYQDKSIYREVTAHMENVKNVAKEATPDQNKRRNMVKYINKAKQEKNAQLNTGI